jgi:hypothetical protein
MGCPAEAENCADPITFVRFVRAGASRGQMERGFNTPRKDLDTPHKDQTWRREKPPRPV